MHAAEVTEYTGTLLSKRTIMEQIFDNSILGACNII